MSRVATTSTTESAGSTGIQDVDEETTQPQFNSNQRVDLDFAFAIRSLGRETETIDYYDVELLFKEVDDIINIIKTKRPDLQVNPDEVFANLENAVGNSDRKEIVIDRLLLAPSTEPTLLTEQVADANMINENPNPFITFPQVDVPQLEPTANTLTEEKIEQPTARKNNVYEVLIREAEIIQTIIRDRDQAEILAYLEAFHDNPNRVQIVVGELLGLDGPYPIQLPRVLPVEALKTENEVELPRPEDVAETNEIPQPSTSKITNPIPELSEKMKEQNQMLCELFPDGDPAYMLKVVEECKESDDTFNLAVASMVEKHNYPKLSEVKKIAVKRKYAERQFSVEEFLQMFEDPEVYFTNTDRLVSANYKQHVVAYLTNTFPYVYKADIVKILEKHKFHLTCSYRELKANIEPSRLLQHSDEPQLKRVKRSKQNKVQQQSLLPRKKSRSNKIPFPEQEDELFYKELAFIEMEPQIKKHIEDKIQARKTKMENARARGELLTCNCCFEDELVIEDMSHCDEGHLFCKDCIRRSAEVTIGQDKFKFPCIDPYCELEFPMIVLQSVLKPSLFSNVLRKKQEEEIRQADIPDLESCPYCSFCAIMSDPNDKVFKCLNPECLKETCRLCKEPNHIPLRCNEVERHSEVRMRTFIENKMTEALLRTCPKCERKFIKDYGCNKMMCTCGQMMCYVCRQPIKDYAHFQNGKCPQFSNDDELHRLEVQTGAEKARNDFILDHPDMAQHDLKHDPAKHIPAVGNSKRTQIANEAMPVLVGGNITFNRAMGNPFLNRRRHIDVADIRGFRDEMLNVLRNVPGRRTAPPLDVQRELADPLRRHMALQNRFAHMPRAIQEKWLGPPPQQQQQQQQRQQGWLQIDIPRPERPDQLHAPQTLPALHQRRTYFPHNPVVPPIPPEPPQQPLPFGNDRLERPFGLQMPPRREPREPILAQPRFLPGQNQPLPPGHQNQPLPPAHQYQGVQDVLENIRAEVLENIRAGPQIRPEIARHHFHLEGLAQRNLGFPPLLERPYRPNRPRPLPEEQQGQRRMEFMGILEDEVARTATDVRNNLANVAGGNRYFDRSSSSSDSLNSVQWDSDERLNVSDSSDSEFEFDPETRSCAGRSSSNSERTNWKSSDGSTLGSPCHLSDVNDDSFSSNSSNLIKSPVRHTMSLSSNEDEFVDDGDENLADLEDESNTDLNSGEDLDRGFVQEDDEDRDDDDRVDEDRDSDDLHIQTDEDFDDEMDYNYDDQDFDDD